MTAEAEVDDIRSEWLDRFGPLPAPAEGLLAVARLRVECLRTGVREVSATPARPGQGAGRPGRRGLVARIAPLELPASARVRLRRLRPESVVKEETEPAGGPARARRGTRRGVDGAARRARARVGGPGRGRIVWRGGAPVECPFREAPPRSGRRGSAVRSGGGMRPVAHRGHGERRHHHASRSSRTSCRRCRAAPWRSARCPSRRPRAGARCRRWTGTGDATVSTQFAAFQLNGLVAQTLEQGALAQRHVDGDRGRRRHRPPGLRDPGRGGLDPGHLAVQPDRHRPRRPAAQGVRGPARRAPSPSRRSSRRSSATSTSAPPRCAPTTTRTTPRSPSCA